MNWFDIILVLVILFGAVGGYREGFLMEVISFVAIFLGVLAGFKLLGKAMTMLAARFDINQAVLPYIAFAVVFVIIVLIVSLLGRLIKASISKTLLGGLDQAMGAMVGMVKTIFLVSICFWIFDSLELEFFNRLMHNSKLGYLIAEVAPTVTSWIGNVFPYFSDTLQY